MSLSGIDLKSPSSRGAFFLVICCAVFLSLGAWTNVHEAQESADQEMEGEVSVIQPNYISMIYSQAFNGVSQEIGFKRSSETQIKHRGSWDEIRAGDKVIFRFREIRGIREGRDEEGAFRRESYVIERQLTQLEFERRNDQAFVSS